MSLSDSVDSRRHTVCRVSEPMEDPEMEPKSRAARINFLSRRSRGNRLRPEVALQFENRLGAPANTLRFLDLEGTDRLRSSVLERHAFSKEAVGMKSKGYHMLLLERETLHSVLAEIRGSFADRSMVLLHELSQFTGGIELDLYSILERAFCLFDLDGEDLVAVENDLATGLMLEYFTDRGALRTQRTYRLVAWQEP